MLSRGGTSGEGGGVGGCFGVFARGFGPGGGLADTLNRGGRRGRGGGVG